MSCVCMLEQRPLQPLSLEALRDRALQAASESTDGRVVRVGLCVHVEQRPLQPLSLEAAPILCYNQAAVNLQWTSQVRCD
jgi:hypothetical protein